MPFITCLFSLIERSISAWHITSQIYIYIPPIMESIAMDTLRYLPSCRFGNLTIMSQVVTAPRSLACAWVEPVMLRSVGLRLKSGNKFIARILSDFLLLHHKSVSYWISTHTF